MNLSSWRYQDRAELAGWNIYPTAIWDSHRGLTSTQWLDRVKGDHPTNLESARNLDSEADCWAESLLWLFISVDYSLFVEESQTQETHGSLNAASQTNNVLDELIFALFRCQVQSSILQWVAFSTKVVWPRSIAVAIDPTRVPTRQMQKLSLYQVSLIITIYNLQTIYELIKL